MLLLHRALPVEAVLAGIDAALAAGRCDPDVVAVEARRHRDGGHRAAVPPAVSPAAAAAGERPVPTLDGYDELLEPGA